MAVSAGRNFDDDGDSPANSSVAHMVLSAQYISIVNKGARLRYASSCCMHVRSLAVTGCMATTYVNEDITMKCSEWGRCEHVHDPGTRRYALVLSGQAKGASGYEHAA